MGDTNKSVQRGTDSRQVPTAESSLFRVTPSAGVVLPVPAVFRALYTPREHGWLDVELENRTVEVPERLYQYELADVDVRDPEALSVLARDLGALLVPVGSRPRWSDSIAVDASASELDIYWDLVAGISDALGLPELDRSLAGRHPENRLHVAEFAVRVWVIQILTGVVQGRIPIRQLAGRESFPAMPRWVGSGWLTTASRLLLGVFGPFLAPPEAEVPAGAWRATALEVATLQLFNEHVQAQAWKVCAWCRRSFTRQRERAKFSPEQSHRRSDSIYCQKRCANAASSAKHRERSKVHDPRKEEGTQGGL